MACSQVILAVSDNASILPWFLCHGATGSIAYLPTAQHKAWPELKPGLRNLHSIQGKANLTFFLHWPAVWEWCIHTGSIIQQQLYYVHMVFSTSLRKQKEIKTDIFFPSWFFDLSSRTTLAALHQGQVLDFCDTWNKGVMPVFVRQSLFATFSRRSSATSRWPEQIKAHTLAQASCWSQRLQYTNFLFQIDKVTV